MTHTPRFCRTCGSPFRDHHAWCVQCGAARPTSAATYPPAAEPTVRSPARPLQADTTPPAPPAPPARTTRGRGRTAAWTALAAVALAAAVSGGVVASRFATADDSSDPAGDSADSTDSTDSTGRRDVFAYLTDTDLVVMDRTEEVTRVTGAATATWSTDGRYVATVADLEVVVVDTDTRQVSSRNCGCRSGVVWGDRFVAMTEDGLAGYALDDVDDTSTVADAPSGVTWGQLVAAGDTLLALGGDGTTDGYRGGPVTVTDEISRDGSVTRIDDDVTASLWSSFSAYAPASAYGGARAVLVDEGSGGACVNPQQIQVFDPADPGGVVDTDTSAMTEEDTLTGGEQETHQLTDLWFDAAGVLHASGDTTVCDVGYGSSRPGIPQQLWRLDGTRWVSDDDRPLLSSHVLPSGHRLELARVTGAAYEVGGILTLADTDAVRELADDVVRVVAPALPAGDPVAARTAPAPVDVDAVVGEDGDTSAIAGLPDDLRDFVAGVATSYADQAATYCDGEVVVRIDRFDERGFAAGDVGACGGYTAVWARTDGGWTEVDGTQEFWHCDLLAQYAVPSALLVDDGPVQCYADDDDVASGTLAYYHPGPTGSVDGDTGDTSDPTYVTPCGSEPVFTPVLAIDTSEGVEITYEVSATCPQGQWLTASQYRVPFVADGFTYADGYFDFASGPQWVPGDTGVTVVLGYPLDVRPAPADTLQDAIDRDGGTGDVVQVPCEPGPGTGSTEPPTELPDAPELPPLDATGSPAEDGTIEPGEGFEEPESVDALTQLRIMAADDYAAAGALTWTTQLSSKRQGIRDDGQVYDTYDAILEHVLGLKSQYPQALLAYSGDWPGSYEPEALNFWIVVSGIDRPTKRPAMLWCVGQGIDRENCWAKTLRTTGDPSTSLLKQPE